MAKVRVSSLAKEFGMTSKELLEHLDEMKIPAKAPSSTLESAYVAVVRKNLAPLIEARAAEIEAKRAEEREAADAAKAEEARRAESARLAAEARREEERRLSTAALAAEETARARAEQEERLARERAIEAERSAKRMAVPPSDSGSRFRSLLDQIAEQEAALKERKRLEEEKKAALAAERRERRQDRSRGRSAQGGAQASQGARRGAEIPAVPSASEASGAEKASGKGRRAKKHTDEDRYTRMAREAEEYSRERVLEEARAAIEEASRESTGRRKKRKEKRVREAEQVLQERKIEEARAKGLDPEELDCVQVSQGVTVAELAEALDVSANDIIKRLFLLGTPLTMTQSMSDDLVELVADDLDRQIKITTPEEENTFTFFDDPDDLRPRPPVVTVMGHVDHGKTSLLDAIRHTGVAAGEAGGITQHIGASEVTINDRQITFVDTPGHEAFTAMRARGARVTDVVVLVVAADDGVMPQTIEAINHSKAADVPIVVAVNKIDKPGANPERVRKELSGYGVMPEEWGGANMFVNVSAKQGTGIDELLETILLQADVLELRANPDTFASGYILEAKLDRGRGPVATVLVNRGTLHVGDSLVAGMSYGRVRAMLDQHGEQIEGAAPSDAAEILGLGSVPAAGDEFRVFADERDARDLAEQRSLKARIEEQSKIRHVTLETLFSQMSENELSELNLVVKADVQGSIEALADALDKMDQTEVRINIIHSAVGAISETDVTLAAASNAIIVGFGVRPQAKARDLAEKEKVQIKTYSIIYKAIEDIDAARIGMLKPTEEEVQTGTAQVRDTFRVPKAGVVAGCMVTEGEIDRDDRVRVVRDGVVVFDGEFSSMRRFKDDVKSVKAGYECGLGIEKYQDIHVGDVFEAYKIVEVARTE
ncbi:bacterial translation initiation factor 2 (bIF-2) [Coriobacterium glomerans PW2]|uniref:Translation initiation factor IF-2 n=1 Tax=Coriobacterium glomerans (strain ATCC 49209 / DSM 20642 / JCM 10262 / PW2) TaxID=700015 RepID=F2N9P8_CORGP|nr:translation initiation factor IF-2 [Coriobacterium glomerans]AEB07151.1 bacterial translation initiation factor 2 (bIF-2) [Coriobacterium glomerans PW2]